MITEENDRDRGTVRVYVYTNKSVFQWHGGCDCTKDSYWQTTFERQEIVRKTIRDKLNFVQFSKELCAPLQNHGL